MPPPTAKFAGSISASTVVEFRRIANEMESRGIEIVDLGAGEPDFDAPPAVKKAAIDALEAGHSHYVDPLGLPRLREVIADFETEHHNVSASPDRIVVGTGSFGIFSIVTRALLDPGDEVLLCEPCWGPYRNIVRLTGAVPIPAVMPAPNGRFEIDADRLTALVTERTRAIVINTPNNPTGRVYTPQELGAVAEIAARHDLWIIADEVYSELVFGGARHVSIASLGDEVANRTVVASSLSKTYAMTGWRLGYCVVPAGLAELLGRINHMTTRCATSIVQYAAIEAFLNARPYVDEMRREYARRRDIIVGGLTQIPGLVCPAPEGTFYAFARYPEEWGNSRDLALRILESSGVIVTPGSNYGKSSEHFLRFSFATTVETIEIGVRRLRDVLSKVDQKAKHSA